MNTKMTTVSLASFIERSERHAARCWDATATVKALEYGGGGQLTFPARSAFEDLFNAGEPGGLRRVTLPMSGRAYQQFVGRISGPGVRWLKGPCPPELEKTVLQRMMTEHAADTLLLRNFDSGAGVVRAVLSSDYTRYDHVRFLRNVRDVLQQTGTGEVRVWNGYIGDTMGTYLVFPDQTPFTMENYERPDRGGDGGLRPAIFLRNSEVGTLAAHITAGVLRLVCTNGLVTWDARSSMVVPHRYKDGHEITVKVAQHLARAMDLATEQIEVLRQAQEVAIADVGAAIARWGEQYRLTQEQQHSWQHGTIAEADARGAWQKGETTLADVVNGLTRASQLEEDESRVELEIVAGRVLRQAVGS